MTERSGIQVVVRLRPMSERELKGNTLPVVTASTEKKEVTVIKGSGARTLRSTFAFDDVFTSFSTQKEVFDQTLAPVIGDVLAGYESTVFAYGQTGTGKTHTMEGNLEVSADRGVIPRAAFDVFRRLRADDAYVDFDVRASFLEIYNEELCDLLVDCDLDDIAAVKAKSKELRLVEDSGGPGAPGKKKGRGVFVMGLTEERVESPEDVLTLMARAAERRKVGETKMNKQSSRSHCVFTMSVRSRRVLTDGSHMECAGKLHMVDLAGSECAKSAGGGDGGADAARERERKNINQSLLTLGRVITLLKNGGKAKGERIPYRDSKLTRLLQESLGGRCKTCVIATVSPSAMSADETLSTLQYAQSAHGIVNKPVAASMLNSTSRFGTRAARDRAGRGAGGAGMTGQTQQDWAEMETRMHYLETQAEEAAAALARKHAEHAALVSRAETAEGAVAVAEKAALVSRAETAETLERLLEKTAENERLGVLLAARVRTEEALTAEAKALLAALDAFADAAARKTKALEAEAAAEAEKRKKARAFGASAAASVASLAAAVEETAAELTAARRRSAARAAEAATAGAEDAAARVAAAADAAAASAAEMSMSAVADADDAAKRRDKLSTKLSAAAKAASEAALQNARNAAKAADAVLAAFAVGESALESWSAAAEKATRDADAEVRALTSEHEQAVASGVADVNASVDDASAALEEQRALLDAAAGRLAAFAAAASARVSDVDACADASRVSASAAADALGASASALEAAKAAHDSERAALAELAAEITARVQKSSAAAAAAAAGRSRRAPRRRRRWKP